MCKEDALPGTQQKAIVPVGNAELAGGQGGFDVGRHVVRSLDGMGVERVTFGNQPVQPVLEVDARAVVVVLLDQQAGGGVANE